MPWYGDVAARWFIVRGYLPLLALLNLVWETAQLPLYTLWQEASPAYQAFAVIHCTAGDALIGSVLLVLALMLGREGELAQWRWRRIVAVMLLLGPGYTVFSEWLNTSLLQWGYSELMPTLEFGGKRIGVSPLLQWLVIPPLALQLARWRPR